MKPHSQNENAAGKEVKCIILKIYTIRIHIEYTLFKCLGFFGFAEMINIALRGLEFFSQFRDLVAIFLLLLPQLA